MAEVGVVVEAVAVRVVVVVEADETNNRASTANCSRGKPLKPQSHPYNLNTTNKTMETLQESFKQNSKP